MYYKIEELYKVQPVYNIADFEINEDAALPGISETKKGIHKETGEVCFFKPFLLREFIAAPLFKSVLGEYTSTQGLAFKVNENDTKTFFIYSKSLGNVISRDTLETRASEACKKQEEANSLISNESPSSSDGAQNAPDISTGNNVSSKSSQIEKVVESTPQKKSLRDFMQEDELMELYNFSDCERKNIRGLEKIIVSFLLFNESDGNPCNILVGYQNDAEGNAVLQSYKIDHGFSLHIPCFELNIKTIYQVAAGALMQFG